MDDLKKLIREVPNFPKPGINFYDITTLLKDPAGFKMVIDRLGDAFTGTTVNKIVGIEARGFIFGPALAYRLSAGFIPVRKPNKLPAQKTQVTYALEYGQDTLEIHTDAIEKGETVLVVDDLLATGGTAYAVADLVQRLGGHLAGFGFVVELEFLHGRERLAGYDVVSLIKYQS